MLPSSIGGGKSSFLRSEDMETLKFAYKYFRKNMPLSIIAELLSLIGIYAELLFPLITEVLLDYCIKSEEVTEDSGGIFHFLLTGRFGRIHSMELFFYIALVYVILLAVRIGFIYIRDLIQEYVGLDLENQLRYASYDKLMELDSQTIADYNSGELLQTLNNDTIMFKELFSHRIPYFMDSIFMFVVTLILIATIDFSLVIIPLLLMPFLIRAVMAFKKSAKDNFQEIRNMSSNMNLTVQENIAAVRIVRSFTNESLEKEKFEKINDGYYKSRMEQVKLTANFDMTFNTIKQLAYIATVVIGAFLAIKGEITIGYVLASSSYVLRLMNNITSLNNHIFNMQQQTVAGLALKQFMEKESEISDDKYKPCKSDTPNIVLRDVSLIIDNQQVLKDINLDIPYGKKLGIVGETGSGKSILLKTLLRIKDITSGSITIDGYDIKEFSLEHLREIYSFVFQNVFLFSNTIESNIAYSKPDIEQRMVTQAAHHAKADKFIDSLQDRYKTIIGERGLGISGGQKQRISIARAFLKNAPVFVLDDSTSALDVNTERALLKDIDDNFSEKTVIITAHRFSSVVNCDEIIYMKDGMIVERGSFEELIKLDGYFAHVYNIQKAQEGELHG